MIAVSPDPLANASGLKGKLSLEFEVYSDKDGALAKALGVWDADNEVAKPASFIVNSARDIVFKKVGLNKNDRPSVDDLIKAAAGAN